MSFALLCFHFKRWMEDFNTISCILFTRTHFEVPFYPEIECNCLNKKKFLMHWLEERFLVEYYYI